MSFTARGELRETGSGAKGYLMRAVSPARLSNMKAKCPFVDTLENMSAEVRCQ